MGLGRLVRVRLLGCLSVNLTQVRHSPRSELALLVKSEIDHHIYFSIRSRPVVLRSSHSATITPLGCGGFHALNKH